MATKEQIVEVFRARSEFQFYAKMIGVGVTAVEHFDTGDTNYLIEIDGEPDAYFPFSSEEDDAWLWGTHAACALNPNRFAIIEPAFRRFAEAFPPAQELYQSTRELVEDEA